MSTIRKDHNLWAVLLANILEAYDIYGKVSQFIVCLPYFNSLCQTLQRFVASSSAAGGRCAGAG